jgi:putative transposase
VHLLVRDKGRKSDETIARSMQLIEGCTAQEYNERKNRRGSFWDDRYHATAVESGQHLMRCMAYINLNMVRAGVVSDPADWPHSGYSDILSHKKRNRIIDYEELFRLFDVPGMKALQERMIQLTAQALAADGLQRQPWWTETVAVGGKEFVERMIEELGIRVGRRSAESEGDRFVLRECSTAYGADFEAKTRSIHVDNTRTWIVSRSL